jgi:hypothetical protein
MKSFCTPTRYLLFNNFFCLSFAECANNAEFAYIGEIFGPKLSAIFYDLRGVTDLRIVRHEFHSAEHYMTAVRHGTTKITVF